MPLFRSNTPLPLLPPQAQTPQPHSLLSPAPLAHSLSGSHAEIPRPQPRSASDAARGIRALQVSRYYEAGVDGCLGRVRAVDTVTVNLSPGDALGVWGGPCSGKSTLLLLLSGLLVADHGSIQWLGESGQTLRHPVGVEYVPPWRNEQALHALFAAVQKRPGIVILDDPLAVLDAASRRTGRQCLRELRAARVSIVIAARSGGEYHSICSRQAVMKGGKFLLA